MQNSINNNIQYSAVSMQQYGIQMIVMFAHHQLEEIKNRFEKSHDKTWMNGQGKLALYNDLKARLAIEDVYFTKNFPSNPKDNQRWEDFNNDCVIYAVLSMVLFNTPIHLIHPDAYSKAVPEKYRKMIGDFKPTAFNDIPIIQ